MSLSLGLTLALPLNTRKRFKVVRSTPSLITLSLITPSLITVDKIYTLAALAAPDPTPTPNIGGKDLHPNPNPNPNPAPNQVDKIYTLAAS